MNRRYVLRQLDKIVEPQGGIALVFERGLGRGVFSWQGVAKEVIERYLGKRRRAGSGFYVRPRLWHEDILARSPFRCVTTYRQKTQTRWTVRSIIGYLYSTSYSSRWLFGKRAAAFERDLRRSLLAVQPSGVFRETLLIEALIARRPA